MPSSTRTCRPFGVFTRDALSTSCASPSSRRASAPASAAASSLLPSCGPCLSFRFLGGGRGAARLLLQALGLLLLGFLLLTLLLVESVIDLGHDRSCWWGARLY